MTEDLDAVYERSLQQAALIGLCDQQRRCDLALRFVEQDICETALEAVAAINNAASIIINIEDLESLFEVQTHDFDRSAQLRPLFKTFYQDVTAAISAGEQAVADLSNRYDFPAMILEHFIAITTAAMQAEDET